MHGKIFIGLVLILFGFSFLLQTLQIVETEVLLSYFFPSLLIIAGGLQISQKGGTKLPGTILFVIGTSLILRNLGIADSSFFSYLWPLLIIFAGIWIIISKPQSKPNTTSQDSVNISALFGGVTQKIVSTNFVSGSISAFFGGCEIDLREANIAEGNFASLNTIALFGGIELKVPSDWVVEVTATPIFGGIENKANSSLDKDVNQKILKIDGLVAFGGIDIYN